MSLKTATLIALIGAVISVALVVLPFLGAILEVRWLYYMGERGILGLVIRAIPPIAYLIFFVALFTRQK